MKVSAATARRFSDSLLRVYAADSEAGVSTAAQTAESVFPRNQGLDWLLDLVRGHAEHRREQLRRGGATSAPRTANLTPREQEVLQRIALGETDAAIGRALGISSKTASKHVENILRKLGVETRTAAAGHLASAPG